MRSCEDDPDLKSFCDNCIYCISAQIGQAERDVTDHTCRVNQTTKPLKLTHRQGQNLKGASPHLNHENFSFRRANTVVQCISAVKLIGPRTIGQLLLLKIKVTGEKYSQGNLWHPLQSLLKLRPCSPNLWGLIGTRLRTTGLKYS